MLTFDKIHDYEQVVFCNDPTTGLQAIIVIHDTTLGPALGGCRMRPYADIDEALEDALRLAKGMTYKNAAADLDFGGGKAVIIGDPATDKTPELFRSLGRYVASLNGRFYTGTDMGTMPEDFVEAMRETDGIVGVPEAYGGHGDSSVPTSQGLIYSLKATSQQLWGHEDLSTLTFALQGLGKVGSKVARYLLDEGASIIATDIHSTACQNIVDVASETTGSVEIVDNDAIYRADADIFIPCAVGGILHDASIRQLQVQAVVGSANNQLAEERHGDMLREQGILYAPDYIVNSGGLIQVSDELHTQGPNIDRVLQKTKAMYDTLLDIYDRAQAQQLSTAEAANHVCDDRIRQRMKHNSFFSAARPPKWRIRQ